MLIFSSVQFLSAIKYSTFVMRHMRQMVMKLHVTWIIEIQNLCIGSVDAMKAPRKNNVIKITDINNGIKIMDSGIVWRTSAVMKAEWRIVY